MSWWNRIIDLLYPDRNICLKCGQKYLFSEIEGICDSCLQQIELVDNYCQICGRELVNGSGFCSFCREDNFNFDIARAAGIYGGLLKNLLIKFKYEQSLELQVPLAYLLFANLQYSYSLEKIDKILSVPIHQNRLKQRGYNQADLLAEELSCRSGISLSKQVKRIKDSPPLYKFPYLQRRAILRDSFMVKRDIFSGQTILIIDDIFTTGATTNEISYLLKNIAGAERVLVLTVATARTF